MKKLVILFAIFAISCNPFKNYEEVVDREKALKNPRFKELPEEEMYGFLNEVYLPHLDSFKMPKRLYIYPMEFKPRVFDTLEKETVPTWPPPSKRLNLKQFLRDFQPEPLFDSTKKWNAKKLTNFQIVNNLEQFMFNLDYRKSFGEEARGLFYISQPMFDRLKKTIIIREFYDAPWCCTCSGETLYFSKTDSGWIEIPPYMIVK